MTRKLDTLKMSKVALFSVVGFLLVGEILASFPENKRICGVQDDSCKIGCCERHTCNRVTGKCMASVSASLLEDERIKLMRSRPEFNRLTNGKVLRCGAHDDDCSAGCCEGYTCNRVTKKCSASISVDMMKKAQLQLQQKQIKNRIFKRSVSKSNQCASGGEHCTKRCCAGLECHPIAGRCTVKITPEILKDARSKLKHVETKVSKDVVVMH